MRRLRKPLLLLCASLLLLCAAEWTERLFFADSLEEQNIHAEAARRYAAAGMLEPVEQDGLRYMGRPCAEVTLRGVTYSHNSLGLRGPEPEEPRPDGLYRILLLGDSNTYGWGVPFEQTFGRLTEERLNRLDRAGTPGAGDRRFEVINAGFVGYNTGDALALFRRLDRTLSPDLVLLIWYANDLERFGFHVSHAGRLFCDPLPLPDAWKPALWRSYLYRTLSICQLSRLKASGRFVLGEGDNLTYGEARLLELEAAVVAQGARFALVDLPVLEPSPGSSMVTPEGYCAAASSEWLANIAGRRSIPLLSFLESISDRAAARYWVLLDPPDRHPNALAHERFAEALTRFLTEQALVPPDR